MRLHDRVETLEHGVRGERDLVEEKVRAVEHGRDERTVDPLEERAIAVVRRALPRAESPHEIGRLRVLVA